jgi:hypothetical protein
VTHVDYPFGVGLHGRTATTGTEDHVRDLIEQVLFTAPGERVNRPDFGTGIHQLVFEPSSPEVASATQLTVQAALQQWLGDLIDVQNVLVESREASLSVLVEYEIRHSGEPRRDGFSREL